MLKSVIKRAVRRAGYQLSARKPGFVDLMQHHGITTVIDVGANEGQFGAEIRDSGFTGDILSFEPIGVVHERLRARSAHDPRWHTQQLAVGDRDERRSINVSGASVFSSFLSLSDYSEHKFSDAHAVRSEEVQVTRLDTWLAAHPLPSGSAYLKIDTQGLEKEVLIGAGDRLASFTLVQAELALRQLYRYQDDWLALVHWMEERGFRVVAAKENGFDHDRVELLELDIVFLNNR